jgi:hypothetical protein
VLTVQVLAFDPARRRQGQGKPRVQGGLGEVLELACRSQQVIKRQVRRQAEREIQQFNFLVKVTGGYPDMLPTPDQIQAFYDYGLEL